MSASLRFLEFFAANIRNPHTRRAHVVTCGQTPVLDPAEARALLDSIDVSKHAGLRDRALIGLMVYSFARIGAALGMAVEDVFTQNRRLRVRLREKGGKRHAMPCHHNLEEYLTGYLDGAELRCDPKGPLFRTIGRGTGKVTRTVLPQANAYARYCMPRGRGPSTYRVRDLEMAIRAVQKRGLNVARVEIAQDGRIVIVAGEPTSMHTPNVADDWEDAR